MEFPRLLYKGPPDATAQTCRVADEDALKVAQKAGWRLTRADSGKKADKDDDDKDGPASPVRGPARK